MYADVSRELVTPGEPAIATVDGAGVGSLVNGRLAGPIRVFSGLHRDESQRQRALLVDLR